MLGLGDNILKQWCGAVDDHAQVQVQVQLILPINFVDNYVESINIRANYRVLASKLNKPEKKKKKMYKIGKMMQRYLVYIECENMYSRLKLKILNSYSL